MTASVTSNEFDAPPPSPPPQAGESLALAITDGESIADCTNLAPFSTSSVNLGSVAFDLNDVDGFGFTGQALCVRNNGTTDITQVGFTRSVTASGEDGCSAAEGAVDPDGTDCGTSGELEDVVTYFFDAVGLGSDVSCGGTFLFPDQENFMLLTGPIQPGQTCMLKIGTSFLPDVTDAQKSAASTDTVTFSIDVSGATSP